MNVTFSVRFPAEARSVPAVRGLLRQALAVFRVSQTRVDEIVLAVTEACTNVLQHSTGHEEYEVAVEVNEEMCEIRVTDAGQGFDLAGVAASAPDSAESGRGIQLMKALVDNVRFLSRPEDGTIVHLEKQLSLRDDSILRSFAPATS